MTAPTSAPAAATLPSRTFCATAGLAAIASSTAAVSAPSSLTIARPRAATTSPGVPSPASTPSMTCRASLSLSSPEATRAATRATSAGVMGSSARSVPDSLARRTSSFSHHLRASAGDAPASTVRATRSTAPAPRIAANSRSDSPHSAFSRARRASGSSGRAALICSTHSRDGATGTRSGSGKYR